MNATRTSRLLYHATLPQVLQAQKVIMTALLHERCNSLAAELLTRALVDLETRYDELVDALAEEAEWDADLPF